MAALVTRRLTPAIRRAAPITLALLLLVAAAAAADDTFVKPERFFVAEHAEVLVRVP